MDGLELIPATPAYGLTGGIGSGTSTVAQMLVACGAHLVDTDAIARELTLPGGAAMPALAQAFGPSAVSPDGAMDRARVRELVFADAGAKLRLEAILHPLIGAEALHRAAASGGRPVVFDVPLMSENSHWRARVRRVLVLDCSVDTQVARVAQRPGWTEVAARSVVAQQSARATRRAIADAVIFNEGMDLAELQRKVSTLWAAWTHAPAR